VPLLSNSRFRYLLDSLSKLSPTRTHEISDRFFFTVLNLMVAYYKALKARQGRGEALRQIQLKMLATGHRKHPYYWASFIQSGEWANLDGKR
jgi:hypothetical protein